MMRVRLLANVLPLALLVASAPPALAQPDEPRDAPAGEDPCRAEPEDGDSRDQKDEPTEAEIDQDLSRQLDRCNGVLTPPDIGEREIIQPPPDVGRTPIIRPGELPKQEPGP